MPTATTVLVKKLITQLNQFIELSTVFDSEVQITRLQFSVSLSYSFTRFSIYQSSDLYFQYTFEKKESLDESQPECYYIDRAKIEKLKKHFEPFRVTLLTWLSRMVQAKLSTPKHYTNISSWRNPLPAAYTFVPLVITIDRDTLVR